MGMLYPFWGVTMAGYVGKTTIFPTKNKLLRSFFAAIPFAEIGVELEKIVAKKREKGRKDPEK